ncbi:MAG: DUF4139 domain-containing protein [Bacteroidales bacterium]|nr:DUF4139 domain-containing protein [Bacteroidales bacterium]
MRTLIVIAAVFITISSLWADEQNIKSRIESVTVFQNGAQINREGSAYLKTGRTELVFSGLAMAINAQSIQVSGKGTFTILGIFHRMNYLEKIEASKRITQMQDSIKMLDKKINYLTKDSKVINEEISLIKSNVSMTGSQTGVKAADLEAMSNFFRKRLQELFTNALDIDYKLKDYRELKSKLQAQLNVLNGQRQEATSEIVVEVIADKAGEAQISLSYITPNANWIPEYDIKATEINKPIELHSRAMIYQNTGVDWSNVKLTLSTGNPNQSGVIPTLYTWYLNFYRMQQTSGRLQEVASFDQSVYQGAARPEAVMADEVRVLAKEGAAASNTSNYTQMVTMATQVKYEISIPYNIPSSPKRTQVKIQKHQLNANYRHYCVPKLDQDVFLQARITGWDELSLVPGEVNIFFEGTYVSKAYLNPLNFSDTLDISLGRDKSIIVKRETVKDKSGNNIVGGTRKAKKSYKITIRNTKSTGILLVIEDHIPISRNKEIEVELQEKGGAKYQPERGTLTWELKVSPRENVEKEYSFQVKYPKDYQITNLN